MKAIPNAQQ